MSLAPTTGASGECSHSGECRSQRSGIVGCRSKGVAAGWSLEPSPPRLPRARAFVEVEGERMGVSAEGPLSPQHAQVRYARACVTAKGIHGYDYTSALSPPPGLGPWPGGTPPGCVWTLMAKLSNSGMATAPMTAPMATVRRSPRDMVAARNAQDTDPAAALLRRSCRPRWRSRPQRIPLKPPYAMPREAPFTRERSRT